MQAVDSEGEVLLVSISVGAALEGLDLVIGSLQWTGRDGVVVPGQ